MQKSHSPHGKPFTRLRSIGLINVSTTATVIFQQKDLTVIWIKITFLNHLTWCICGWQLHSRLPVKNFDNTSHFPFSMETHCMRWILRFCFFSVICTLPTWRRDINFFIMSHDFRFYCHPLMFFLPLRTISRIPPISILRTQLLLTLHHSNRICFWWQTICWKNKPSCSRSPWSEKDSKLRRALKKLFQRCVGALQRSRWGMREAILLSANFPKWINCFGQMLTWKSFGPHGNLIGGSFFTVGWKEKFWVWQSLFCCLEETWCDVSPSF